ncbi:signal peptidase I [Kordia periserrulae]|uniref:Signal peptidase I n=1 Tax=Kordia periserrulae TaxID=701523 RepID=A0A2T6BXP8_9FLAO|nr:signal peptidase I [Kordia periserrulae]PTX60859.1 signal peptidase I [Kordia periserrulae]
MNKKLKITLYIVVGLIVVYQILNMTGILAFFSIPTSSSEPTIKRGSFIIASNLITPKRGDFITYNFEDTQFGKTIFMHRLCAMENDTLEIREGTLFVNGKNVDTNYNLQYSYFLSEEEFKALPKNTIKDFFRIQPQGNDSYLVHLEEKDAAKYKLASKRAITPKDKTDQNIKAKFQQHWNKDFFGPLIIHKGKVFVLGDNRDNSMDSRHYGLVDMEDITGVYLATLFVIDSN